MAFDEAFTAGGEARPHYAGVLQQLAGRDLEALRAAVQRRVEEQGCRFGDEPFLVDPVPRLLTAQEWERLEAGLTQRARALEAFAADVHGERRALSCGAIPEHVVAGAAYREPEADRLGPPAWIGVAGLDVVRAPDGEFLVLEDNVRTPSGLAYAIAARRAVGAELDLPPCLDPQEPVRELLGGALRAAAPAATAGHEPVVAMLSDGPGNAAWWEHELLARLMGIELVQGGELRRDGRRLLLADGRAVDVLYRRTDTDRLREPDGRRTALGELLEEPLRAGTIACVSAPGAGIADDKLVHPYVPALVRALLGEEPLLEPVPTYDLQDPAARAEALERLGELVVKRREAYGGQDVVVCRDARPEDVRRAEAAIRDEPDAWIAQETVDLSVHPTVADGTLAPRHVDLRPFVVLAGGRARAVPGGLTRVALGEGDLVVNSSQGGGAKDTVVLTAA